MAFPHDENGDVLRRMEANGDNLRRPRDVDFTVVFADATSAENFAAGIRELGYKVSVKEIATDRDLPWDALIVKHMVPTHDAIGEFEDFLQAAADEFGGRNDGWGCFSQPS